MKGSICSDDNLIPKQFFEWFEKMFTDTAILSASLTSIKWTLFPSRHTEYLLWKKKKKNCGKMTSLPFPGTLICAVFVSRNDGMKRQNRWSCDFKKRRRRKKSCGWLWQAYFIWFHQALATERPSHCHLWLGCRWTCTQWTKLVELNSDFIPGSQWQQPV